VTETEAPAGYSLPTSPSQDVVVTANDLDYGTTPVEGAAPVSVEFQDPPLGDLAIAKAHQELSGGTWVPGDGTVKFNDQVKYVITVTATGKKVFHDVAVTDYVPGYGPNAGKTQLGGFKGVIDPTSIKCSATFTPCGTDYNATTGLVTWSLGDVGNESGTVEFIVRMPNLPVISPLAAPGVSFAGIMWNQAYVSWTQADDTENTPAHTLASNEVTDRANATLPPKVIPPKPPQVSPPAVLPNTGGPSSWLLGAGLILLLGGGTLIAADRRRRHRS
jgi:LPXTG-motif cell wall-anchored protein